MRSFVLSAAVLAGLTSVAAAEPYTHDGFYFGLQGGLGYAHIGGPQDSTLTGVSVPNFALNIGKSLTSHLVLGGGLFFDYVGGASFESGGQSGDVSGAIIPLGLGAFADYYLDPHAGGLHFQAFLGWGGYETTENTGGSDPTGLTIYAGAGWDKFISSEMSVGVLGRLGYGSWSISGADFTFLSPSVMGTVTWH